MIPGNLGSSAPDADGMGCLVSVGPAVREPFPPDGFADVDSPARRSRSPIDRLDPECEDPDRVRRRPRIRAATTAIGLLLVAVLVGPVSARPQAATDAAREYKLGKGHYDLGLTDRAIPHFERVRELAEQPESAVSDAQHEQVLFLLGECYFVGGTYDRAGARYLELIRLFPQSSHRGDALVRAAESLVKLERPADALEVAREVIDDPKLAASSEHGAPALFWSGEAHSRVGEAEPARERFGQLIARFPDHRLIPFARFNLAGLLRAAEDNTAALDQLSALRETPEPLVEPVALLEGDLSLLEGDLDRAARSYARIATGPNRPAALEGLGRVARRREDRATLHRIQEELATRFATSPERERIDLVCGAWAAEAGEVSEADRYLAPHDPVEGDGDWADPLAAEARFWRGWARGAAGDSEGAIAIYRPLSERDGDWASWAHFRLSAELRRAAQWRESLEESLAFATAHPEDSRTSEALAGAVECAFRIDEHPRALELAGVFHQLYPDHRLSVEVDRFASESALASQRWDDAIRGYESVVSKVGDDDRGRTVLAESLPRLAWARFQRDGAEAVEAIETIVARLEALPNASPTVRAEVGTLLGHARSKAGNVDGAIDAFTRAAAADPRGEAGARAALEAASLRSGATDDPKALVANYEKIIERSEGETRARARLELAELLVRLERDAEAQSHFRSYIDEAPTSPEVPFAWLSLAFCQWRLGELEPASASLSELTRVLPAESALEGDVLFLSGQVAAGLERPEAAESAWSKYLAEHAGGPREARVLRDLARLSEANGDPAAAIGYLERRVDEHPRAAGADEALYRLAWLRQEEGQADEALAAYERLIEEYPESGFIGDAQYRLGDLAYAAEDYDRARTRYEAALASPEAERLGEFARYRIAWTYQRQEQWAKAFECFESLAEQHPETALGTESLFLGAEAAAKIGRADDERRLLEAFLARAGRHEYTPDATIRLSELLTLEKNWKRVRHLLEPMLSEELSPNLRARHRVAFGRALRESGAAKSAIRYLEEALEEGRAIAAEAQFEIGLAHRDLGDRKQAISVFTSGPILYPFKPWALRSYLEAARDMIAEGSRVEARRLLERAIEQDDGGPWGEAARQMLGSLDRDGEKR